MEKLKMHTLDLTAEQVRRIAELLPNCVTEAQGPMALSVRRSTSTSCVRNYRITSWRGRASATVLDWPGKSRSIPP